VDQFSSIAKRLQLIENSIKSGKIRTGDRTTCNYCFDSGLKEVDDPADPLFRGDRVYRGVVRCNRCFYWENRANAMKKKS